MPETRIVIPCYNEERRLPAFEFDAFLHADPSVAFCFVNDGSTDNTLSLLKQIQADHQGRVEVIDLPCNAGKAEAVRAGVLRSMRGHNLKYIGFFDADLATPLSAIRLLTDAFAGRDDCALAFGARIRRPGAVIDRSVVRHYFSRIFAAVARRLLRLPISDTQCGAKLFKADLAAQVFAEPFITRWLFDVEIFARIIIHYGREGASKILAEVPLNHWEEKGASKIRFSYMAKILSELLALYRVTRGMNRQGFAGPGLFC
jgi:glycosyltransferase involved in cell wall biosynthesis